MKILFKDEALPQSIPFSRLRTIFSFRDGIFTPIERVRAMYGDDIELYFSHPNKSYQDLVAPVDGLIALPEDMEDKDFDYIIGSSLVDTISIIERAGTNINSDLKLIDKSSFLSPEEFTAKFPLVEIIGSLDRLFVSRSVKILSRNTVFDTTDGVIIINDDTTIAPFTHIAGNVYIGKGCDIVNARISHDTIVGNRCRVSGEVSNAIFNDFSYKSHDGFIGCTVIGTWVNFGALTTTSNLKNNYSIIKLSLPQTMEDDSERVLTPTNQIKFGSLIGDYTKTAIGTMINCGTVLDSGSNVLSHRPEKYTPALSWLDAEHKYDKTRFTADCKYILSRKGVELHENFAALVEMI